MSGRPEHKNNEVYKCDICGRELMEWQCELICPNCGYRRVCTDG